jgi:hypothetical protein
MIKFIAAALWIVAVTVGAVLYSFQSPSEAAPPGEKPPALLGGLDYVKTDVISVPVLRDNEISGYFLGRFVYTIEPEDLAKLSVPAQTLITDEVYSHLFGNPRVDFTRIKTLDLDAFRASVRDAINKRIGEEIVQEVLIEQLDFLTKSEIRDNSMRRQIRGEEGGESAAGGAAEVDAEAAAPSEPTEESAGH